MAGQRELRSTAFTSSRVARRSYVVYVAKARPRLALAWPGWDGWGWRQRDNNDAERVGNGLFSRQIEEASQPASPFTLVP
jgi:hypothetical protein